jgi:hypothetical protein
MLRDLLVAKEEFEGRNEALRLVNELGLRLQRGLDLPTIATETVDALASYSRPSPAVFFYMLDGLEGPLRLVDGHGLECGLSDDQETPKSVRETLRQLA